MENSFLSEFKERNYFNQCTNSHELEQVMNKNKIRAYIFNDLSQSFEPIFTTPGGSSISVDMDEGTASFDTQVLGVFAIGMEDG